MKCVKRIIGRIAEGYLIGDQATAHAEEKFTVNVFVTFLTVWSQ
jgi:hypothetical protein